jgi:hypothetical protein
MILLKRCLSSALLFLALAAAAPPAKPRSLQISADFPLPMPAFQWASDVRWAGDHSVYLGLGSDGAVEVTLDPAKLAPKEMIPGSAKPGGFWGVERLAASPRFLVAAGPALLLTWRKLDDPLRVEQPFEGIQAIDVQDNRLAIVGVRRDEQREVGKDGAIAWTGTLDKQLSDLKPFLYDVGGPGAPAMNRCIITPLGEVRFLADGSLAVAPGVQPGIHLYDAQGKLTRTWDTASLGIDSDCASLSEELKRRLAINAEQRHIWVNQRRTLDTLLPLDSGLGLVIRRVENGHTRWGLKLLRFDGSVESYDIPVEGPNEFFHLRGDVRSGKIVFLLKETIFRQSDKERHAPPRLLLAPAPAH